MVDTPDPKTFLLDYLQNAREAMVWKLDGLSEYDVRRPLTPTGTNLLGLVKHLTGCELGYFGETFGRPTGITSPWEALDADPDADPNADMYATPGESREHVVGLYRRSWEVAGETVAALDLDAPGRVPWWGEHGQVTLHRVVVHMIAETCRHAGHADVLREGLDGSAGRFAWDARQDDYDWSGHVGRVEAAARAFT